MTTAADSLFRSLLIYSICVPVALILGYMMATPYDFSTFAVVLGTRSCKSKSAALKEGVDMNRRCIGRPSSRYARASKLMP